MTEIRSKEQKRISLALRGSGLPYVKTIDEFDFTFQPGIERRQVMNLFDCSFIEQKKNVIFLGPPGVGKTHLAAALLVKAAECGESIHFTTLIYKLRLDRDAGRAGKRRRPYECSSLVVVDEVGYTPIDREECNLFYQFVAMRYPSYPLPSLGFGVVA